ncbi:hypothetical protein NA612_23215, partial [Salmonella sp. NW378]|uniref:hypothetical protein n=1 Tax=Salmonella sp. NW378 TaxID=2947938 RepID=UPI003F43D798
MKWMHFRPLFFIGIVLFSLSSIVQNADSAAPATSMASPEITTQASAPPASTRPIEKPSTTAASNGQQSSTNDDESV